MRTAAEKPQLDFLRDLIPSKAVPGFHELRYRTANGRPLRVPLQDIARKPLDVAAFFGCRGPVQVEIGCGKGGFMLEYCLRHPRTAYLGIEKEYSIALYAAKRIAKRPGLDHVRTVWGEAYPLLRDFVPGGAVGGFHVYFPDPWPKKRHRKRRLMHSRLLDEMERTAAEGARLHWATDFREYHQQAEALFSQRPRWRCIDGDAGPTEAIVTNFESKYRREGRPIYRSIWQVEKPGEAVSG